MESILNNLPEPNESLLGAVNTLANSAPDEEQSLLNNINAAANELTGEPIVLGQKKLTHEEQAKIIFENYIQNTQRFLSGKEKRRLYRECLRNAKKGRYEYLFDESKQAKKRERAAQAFDKMNNPSKAED